MLEISNNSSSIMRSCQMKYKWYYIDGLKPIKKSSALSLGTVIHQAFDMFYNGFTSPEVLKYIVDTMDDQIANSSPEEIEDLSITKYTLMGMWENCPFKLNGFKKIIPEKEFKVRVPGTRGIVYVGKVDGLVTDLTDRMWVRELKSTSLTFQQFEVRSKQSSQGTGYIWALRQLGFPIQGIIYDYIKKPLLRKGNFETVDQFGARIREDYKTRSDMYYKRHPSYRTDDDLDMFENDMRNIALDIRRRAKDHRWSRNTDQCWNYNQLCQYYPICFQKKPDALTVQLMFEQKATTSKGAKDAGSQRTGISEPGSDEGIVG